MSANLAAKLAAAVDALSQSTPQASEANAFLVSLSSDPSAPQACEALLAAPDAAPEPALVVAAGILTESLCTASVVPAEGAARAVRLLELCAGVPSRPAAARLAKASAALAAASHSEPSLLATPLFVGLDQARQLMLLQALPETLETQCSPEELSARAPARGACTMAVRLLQRALLPPPAGSLGDAEGSAAALACLASWAACGLFGYGELSSEPCEPLLEALLALVRCPLAAPPAGAVAGAVAGWAEPQRVLVAALAANTLRCCVACSMDLYEEHELEDCSELLAAVAAYAPHVAGLGVPRLDSAGITDGGEAAGGEGAARLASELVGLAALTIELLAEPVATVDLTDLSRAADADTDTDAADAAAVRGACALMLAGSAHPLESVAEAAAGGWTRLLEALPPRSAPFFFEAGGGPTLQWRNSLFTQVASHTVGRSSYAQLRRGTGEDAEDVVAYRDRCSTALLRELSVELGLEWLRMLSASLSQSLAGFPASEEQVEAVESLLAAAAATSPRCATARLHDAEAQAAQVQARGGVAAALAELAARAGTAAAQSLPGAQAGMLGQSAAAAIEALRALQAAWAGQPLARRLDAVRPPPLSM